MSIFDYHRRVLCQELWGSDEITLSPKARKQLDYQVRKRFPTAASVLLLGELMGHYYDEQSPLDVIILAPPKDLEKYQRQAYSISGYRLANTDHSVNFYVLPTTYNAAGIADFFGSLYDVRRQAWVGQRPIELSQMAQPENLLRTIRWQLYKVKDETEAPYPREWQLVREAFARMGTDDRAQVLTRLQQTGDQLYINVMETLNKEPEPSWRGASDLEETFREDPSEHALLSVLSRHRLPDFVVGALFNRFRYLALFARLNKDHNEMLNEEERRIEQQMARVQASVEAPHEIRYRGARYVKLAPRCGSK